MFTGLIKDLGTIKKITSNKEGKEFIIETSSLKDLIEVDDSVATNGVCLTATKVDSNSFVAQAVHVTLEKTSLGKLQVGSKVNLELALRASDRLGGHIVQGHVNGIASIAKIRPLGKNFEIEITPKDSSLFKYIIAEGSVAIDGISLTVARRTNRSLTVSIIPHTFDNTTLHLKKIGDLVNIEVDIMAKYLENFMTYNRSENFQSTEKKDKSLKDLL